MASSNIVVCNLSLGHLAITKGIASLTEASKEARACNQFFETSIRETMRDGNWAFCAKFAALALVEADPTEEWAYSYGYPTDCLNFRRILSGTRNDSHQSKVRFKRASIDNVQVILTDKEDAESEFTFYNTNVQQWPDDFVMAASLRLAGYIAPALTGADPFKLGERAMLMYSRQILMAGDNSANEEQPDIEPPSEFESARS